MEYLLARGATRGVGYVPTLFGRAVPSPWVYLLQGVTEGGPLTFMGFWFAELASNRPLPGWAAYVVGLGLIFVLSIIVCVMAAGEPFTSVRPMGRWDTMRLGMLILPIVLVFAVRGRLGLRSLLLFATGVIVYLVVTYQPMQAAGVRLIAEKVDGTPRPSGLWTQLWVMAYSQMVEVPGGKLHYFVIPYLLGWLNPINRLGVNVDVSDSDISSALNPHPHAV